MQKRAKHLFSLSLIVVLIVCCINLIAMKVSNNKTDAEIEATREQIREENIRNAEREDILSSENQEDFYRNQAEDNLGYGVGNEKIYVDITGY